ncbi:helix-turn-helix domain-containing protein [Paenibacillus sp. GCM10023252]|uniref:helix-turn-helix domain-containing protein n=1 Tax=Paenibacillus sp. GCM10023252 TaxID=3252649 RepID=UPI003624428E
MTYPQELHEMTKLMDSHYPVNVFRNSGPEGRKDGCILGLHWHEHFELILMVAGEAVFHIDSQPYDAVPGDILIVPAGGLHVGYSTSNAAIEYVSVVFNPSLLSPITPDPVHAEYMMPYLEGSTHFPVKLPAADLSSGAARHILEQAISEFEAKKRAYQIAVRTYLYLLLTQLSRQFLPESRGIASRAAFAKNSDRFKPLIRYVESRYADKLTIGEAAKMVNMNPYHFCKSFKKLTGSTFIEFVNRHRMLAAERLLVESDHTITEIAEQVGCGNPNYFTKMFKQFKGIPPSQVRRGTCVPE